MSEASLRRSTRRNTQKRERFNVGDIVELTRSGQAAHGRLVIQLSDDPARWLVTYDGGQFKDEELPEESLGPVIGRIEDSDSGDHPKARSQKKKTSRRNSNQKHGTDSRGSSASSNSEDNSGTPEIKRKRKASSTEGTGEDHGFNNDTDASSPNDSAKRSLNTGRSKVSDREQRSRRRHQMIEDEVPSSKTAPHKSHGAAHPSTKKAKTKGDEEVIKIPMLTGTLFLYRGVQRRVAFVRKY